MTITEPEPVAQLFARLVPGEVAVAYEKLLEADGVAEERASCFLGGDDIVRRLLDLGMARVFPPSTTRPTSLSAVGPELAIQGILADLGNRVTDMIQVMAEGTRLSTQIHGRQYVSDGLPADRVEIITDRNEIMHVSAALINSARTDWMTLDNLNHEAELTEQSIINAPKALGSHIRRRSIYDRAFIDDPTGRRLVDKAVAAGEEARVLPRIPMKMQLADTSAVLLPLTFTGTGGAMLVRAQPVVAGMRDFYELLWESAAPLTGKAPSGKSPLTPAQQKVLELLAQGYQDEAIARRIGVSDTTVHRHAQAIQKRLKAKTRFEAAVIAHRMGWIG